MTIIIAIIALCVAVLAAAAFVWRNRRQPPTNRPKSDGGPGEEKPR